MKKNIALTFLIVIIIGILFWKFFPFVSDKTAIIPSLREDKRGEIVTADFSESFDTNMILAMNPTYASSSQELIPQLPPEASNNTNILFMAQNLVPKYPVDKYLVTFKSTDENNEFITITSQIFIPKTDGSQKLPVYVFGQGTTGIGDECAPSKEQPRIANWANYLAHMLAFSAQGYIVVFPDYEGFNDDNKIHHYFNSELESRVLLDATRAVYRLEKQQDLASKPDDTVFIAGFSQGGHAALSAKDFVSKYASNLPIKGIIAYAPATNATELLKEAPALGPYLIYAYADFYGKDTIDPQKVLQPKWLPTLEQDVTSICIDKIYEYYGYDPKQIYTQEFYEALFTNNLEGTFPKFKEALDKNTTGFEPSQIPIVVYQGATDDIVTAKTVRKVAQKLCDLGNKVTYKEYANMNHFKIRQISYRDTLAWMQQIVKGELPRSDCNLLN